MASGVDRREALDQVERVAVEVAGPIEPVLAVEFLHVDDQRIALPAARRMPHAGVSRRALDLVEVNRPRGVREREHHLHLVRALRDLKRVRHVHRARRAGQIALQLRIAIDPVLGVLLPHGQRFRLVGNPAVALHHAERGRHAGSRAERERREPPARACIRTDTRLAA